MVSQSNDDLKNRIQRSVDELFSDDNEDMERAYELYIISSIKFKTAVHRARNKLRLEKLIDKKIGIKAYKKAFADLMELDDYAAVDWAINQLANTDKNGFYEVVEEAVKEAGLPKKWCEYMAIYIIKQRPPKANVFPPTRYVTIKNINEEEITISIKKGLRHEQYIKTWKAISEFLGRGSRKLKSPDPQTRVRDLQMYGKRETYGSTYKQLADEYINSAINTDDAKDTVKKALKRQKKLFGGGTDLAK